MNLIRKICMLLALPYSCTVAQEPAADSIPELPYRWIRNEYNQFQFYNRKDIQPFFDKLGSKQHPKLSIVHFGDSHIQPDILTNEYRSALQNQYGNAGLGLVFPFSVAKTYSSILYSSSFTGSWVSSRSLEGTPKLMLGVLGAACWTRESGASLSIHFKVPMPNTYTRLKVFCRKDEKAFSFYIDNGHETQLVNMDSFLNDGLPYIPVDLHYFTGTVKLRLTRTQPGQTDFDFYGFSIEDASEKGVVVHAAGIGGAPYNAILHQPLLAAQLPSLNPDLVILDYGTNDYLYKDYIKGELYNEINEVIDVIRKSAPEASILLTTTQDMYRKGKHIVSGPKFAALIRQIARERGCAVYDWYSVSGGNNSMPTWRGNGLAQPDMIHLNMKGYQLKGKLLYDALRRSGEWLQQHPDADSLILIADTVSFLPDTFSIPVLPVNDAPASPAPKPAVKKGSTVKHKVKSGQTLSSIARTYGVTVEQIKKWNHLRSSLIKPGQILIIQRKK